MLPLTNIMVAFYQIVISFSSPPTFKFLKNSGRYGDLFVEALRLFGMLCIGIYRVKDPTGTEPTASSRRYVITNPPGDFILTMSDLVSINLLINKA